MTLFMVNYNIKKNDMKLKKFCRKGSDNQVKFSHYSKGKLYYTVADIDSSKKYNFPVPIEDCGDGMFLAEDRANLFMRYIRKAIAAEEIYPIK